MKITEIIAHNFQSHAHTVVELTDGLNIFVGETDQGKTSLAKRCTRWCLFGEPQGDDFVRFKDGVVDKDGNAVREDECYVTLKFDNGVEVTRLRKKKKNFYQLVTEDGEVMDFENFGTTIPEEIIKATGIHKLKVDDDLQFNLNIIGAKDRSLIYESGNVKAKVIGSFAGTNVIDVTVRGIKADMLNISGTIKKIEEDIKKTDEEIEAMGDMQQKEENMKKIDNLFYSLSEENFVLDELKRLKESIILRNQAIHQDKLFIESCQDLPDKERRLAETEALLETTKEKALLLNRLMNLRHRINTKKQVIRESKDIILKLKDIDQQEAEVMKKELAVLNVQNQIFATNNTLKTLLNVKAKMQHKKRLIDEALAVVNCYKQVDVEEKALLEKEKQLDVINRSAKEILLSKEILERKKQDIQRKTTLIQEARTFISQKDKEIADLVEACVGSIGKLGKCPTCMSDLDDMHLEKVKQELINL